MFKLFVLFAVLATINAQYITPAITSQDQNIYRTFGNLGQVSTHSKTIDTPFSSVSKSDVRVSNPGIYGVSPYARLASPYGLAAPAHYGLAAPAHYGLAAPAPLAYPRPIAHAAVAPAGLLGVAYSAAPAVAHMSYSNGLGLSYAW